MITLEILEQRTLLTMELDQPNDQSSIIIDEATNPDHVLHEGSLYGIQSGINCVLSGLEGNMIMDYCIAGNLGGGFGSLIGFELLRWISIYALMSSPNESWQCSHMQIDNYDCIFDEASEDYQEIAASFSIIPVAVSYSAFIGIGLVFGVAVRCLEHCMVSVMTLNNILDANP